MSMVLVADRTNRVKFRRNYCPPAGRSFNRQPTRISTSPSVELQKESVARLLGLPDGTANANGNARRYGFPGSVNPKFGGGPGRTGPEDSHSLDPRIMPTGNSRNRHERKNDSGNTR